MMPDDAVIREIINRVSRDSGPVVERQRASVSREATIIRLITILRDETHSPAVRAECVEIVGDKP